jgi:tRNA threonylcarbamoyladenosine biosynthesis protein TsaB
MMTLALDTSTRTASVALLREDKLAAEYFLNTGLNHSETVLNMIEDLLKRTGVDVEEIDHFSLAIGPGSFTGLRIGAGIIKGMAFSTGKPVTGVSTLEVLAMNAAGMPYPVCPMLDARKKEVYTALYRINERGFPVKIREEQVVDPAVFLADIDEPVVFLGEGVEAYRPLIERERSDSAIIPPAGLHYIRASNVGFLGLKKVGVNDIIDVVTFVPKYFRRSEAEMSRLHPDDKVGKT